MTLFNLRQRPQRKVQMKDADCNVSSGAQSISEVLSSRIFEYCASVKFGEGKAMMAQCEIKKIIESEPVPVLLFCPNCKAQHIDAPEPEKGWTNPPHKSHLCHYCKTIWRPADVATTGVEKKVIATCGAADTW